MTGKRFTMIYFETDGNLIFDETKHDGEWYDSTDCLQDNEIVELLNELHEESEQLKQKIKELQGKASSWKITASEQIMEQSKLVKENEQLKKAIVETEKMVQSTYDELTKLRCFKKNILRIKHSWDYLMEAIQYD